jgi:hypothetical protein
MQDLSYGMVHMDIVSRMGVVDEKEHPTKKI